MRNSNYQYLKNKGKAGEEYFLLRHNELLRHPIVPILKMADWHIEGSDIGAERLMLKPVNSEHDLQDLWIFDTGKENKGGLALGLQYGGVEVKASSYSTVLPRSGVDGQLTQGVEFWGGNDDSEDHIKYTRARHGNLERWMHPSVDNRGARPLILAQLLENPAGSKNGPYFASIVFEDVEALIDRLIGFASPFGLDLLDWDKIPVGEEAKNFRIPGLYFQGDMWHVPMSVVGDLATVTIIGDGPDICGPRDSIRMQNEKYEQLKALAAGRWIPQEKPADMQDDKELFDLWHNKLLLGNPHYQKQRDIHGRLMIS